MKKFIKIGENIINTDYIEKISKDVKFGKIYTTIHMTSGIDYQIDNEYYFKLEQLLNPLVINTMNQI